MIISNATEAKHQRLCCSFRMHPSYSEEEEEKKTKNFYPRTNLFSVDEEPVTEKK
mgnify:CR=1 FL=1